MVSLKHKCESMNPLITKVFEEQPLASPGSANNTWGKLISIKWGFVKERKFERKLKQGKNTETLYCDTSHCIVC